MHKKNDSDKLYNILSMLIVNDMRLTEIYLKKCYIFLFYLACEN